LGTIRLAAFLKNSLGTGRERLRIYGSYAIVYLLAGSGHYRDANGNARAVAAGDLIWVYPDLGHDTVLGRVSVGMNSLLCSTDRSSIYGSSDSSQCACNR
jgi:hypothetical protein